MNVIDSIELERDAQISLRNLRKIICAGKAVQRSTFPGPAPATRLAQAWRLGGKAAAFGGLGLAVLLICTPAQAQYFRWGDGPYYEDGDYPGPGPEGDYSSPRGGYPNRPPSPPADVSPRATLSLADIRQHAEQRGLHLIATPRRKGRIYLAEAEDSRGLRHRLVFDAYEGRLIENTVLSSKSPSTEKPAPNGETPRP